MSRSRRERRDSVDASVLAERAAWAARLEASPPETAEEAARERDDEKRFKKAGLGVRRAGKRGVFGREGIEAARVGSQRCGGAPPPLKHALPEVLLVGAANAGKSTLINALVGAAPASKAGLGGGEGGSSRFRLFSQRWHSCESPCVSHQAASIAPSSRLRSFFQWERFALSDSREQDVDDA